MSTRLPTVFISHGAPTFAIDSGQAGPALAALGQRLPRPQAVLVVSPHWMTPQPRVATTAHPATIHDFGGFDDALYQLQYPAPGHPALAARAVSLLNQAGWPAAADSEWGFDHGTWVPLLHLLPKADVPVFQVSLPQRLNGALAYAYGQALAPLADEGVLIVGSGSLTHNLREVFAAPVKEGSADASYVQAFTDWVAKAVLAGDHERLQQTLQLAPHAARAHPTPEHFWPLLVAAGAAGAQAVPERIDGGVTYVTLSMDCFVWGGGAMAS